MFGKAVWGLYEDTLRVQVPNDHVLAQNLYYNYYCPKLKYLIIGYMDPVGYIGWAQHRILQGGLGFHRIV